MEMCRFKDRNMSEPEPLSPSLTCVPAAGRHMAASSECALCAGAGLSGEDQATLYSLHTPAAGPHTYTYTVLTTGGL